LQYERGNLADLEDYLVMIIDAQPEIPVWRMALCGVYLQTGRIELARPHVEAVGANDFAMVPRNQVFLVTCASTAPFDDVFPFTGTSFEVPVGIGVGAAATALGWYDQAEQHYANAHALCERAGAPTYLAAGRVHWAEMLVRRDEQGDAQRAREFALAARDTRALPRECGRRWRQRRICGGDGQRQRSGGGSAV